ncbi:MAG: hypothetical protein H7070_03210, partial [Saprospiraceae bacterium]|nr:hypothetical protein [Pyrinomonadaceae bacterium]
SQKSKEFEKTPKTEKEAVDYAFEILSNVAQANSTQWSIVYDQKRSMIYFRTRQSPSIKSVDMKAFDYACGTPVKIIDIDTKTAGDISASFKNYSREANRDLIERAFGGTDFLKGLPQTAKDGYAAFPERFACSNTVNTAKAQTQHTANMFHYIAYPALYVYKQLVSS